jgi:hypothetical protein
MFGRKPSYERQPWDTPGIGDGFNQRMAEMGDVNPSAMPIGVEQMTQKQSFFQRPGVKTAAGILGDTLLTLGGGKPMYAPMMHERRMQEEDARLRQQLAQQQRMQAREDLRWKWANEPKDNKPDQLTEWMISAGIDPRSEQGRDVYRKAVENKVNPPVWRQGPDGNFYRVDTPQGGLPTFTDDDWNKAGGSGGNVTGGFRR